VDEYQGETMFDTYVTVVGTALNTPERRVTKNNAVVANFRVATHARRYDKEAQEWVDAPNLRIRVNCWRRLAENVCSSIVSGDPVVVYGRIATRDWTNEHGEARIAYEVEAVSVGHDLARGVDVFTRSRSESSEAMVEDPDAEGEPAPRKAADGGSPSGYDEYGYADSSSTEDALAILDAAGLDGSDAGSGGIGFSASDPAEEESEESADDEEEALAGSSGGRGRKRARQPVPA
jgi:single-strand DNA-binding protein